MSKFKFNDGTLCHINFGKASWDGEISKYHLGVLYNIKGVKNTVLCIPLTSPKEKHFKTKKDFEERNYLDTKFFRLHYIKQTDSIALLEQTKTISINRISNYYKNEDNKIVVLNDKEQQILKNKLIKYLKMILHKK